MKIAQAEAERLQNKTTNRGQATDIKNIWIIASTITTKRYQEWKERKIGTIDALDIFSGIDSAIVALMKLKIAISTISIAELFPTVPRAAQWSAKIRL